MTMRQTFTLSVKTVAGLFIVSVFGTSLPAVADGPPKLRKEKCGTVSPLHVFDGIYMAGQPSADDLKKARAKGIKTVINLRTDGELDWDEAAAVKKLGMKYIHIPFRKPSTLTDDVFDRVREVLKNRKNKPILLHCGSANRVGAVWLAHRVLDHRQSFAAALKEARIIGLRTPGYVTKARNYIERKK